MRMFHQRERIQDVFAFFVKNYVPGAGEHVVNWEANYDPNKGEVIFTLYIESDKEPSVKKK